MDNINDKKYVVNHVNELKDYNEKLKECLTSIQLIVVDNNNSRVKDESLKSELNNLANQIDSLTSSIEVIEKKLI